MKKVTFINQQKSLQNFFNANEIRKKQLSLQKILLNPTKQKQQEKNQTNSSLAVATTQNISDYNIFPQSNLSLTSKSNNQSVITYTQHNSFLALQKNQIGQILTRISNQNLTNAKAKPHFIMIGKESSEYNEGIDYLEKAKLQEKKNYWEKNKKAIFADPKNLKLTEQLIKMENPTYQMENQQIQLSQQAILKQMKNKYLSIKQSQDNQIKTIKNLNKKNDTQELRQIQLQKLIQEQKNQQQQQNQQITNQNQELKQCINEDESQLLIAKLEQKVCKQNEIIENLIQKNQICQQNYNSLQQKFEQQSVTNQKLMQFKESIDIVHKEFPEYNLLQLLQRHKCLEELLLESQLKISNYEHICNEHQGILQKNQQEMQQKVDQQAIKFFEANKQIQILNEELKNRTAAEEQSFKNQYLQLTKKIIELYNNWSKKISVYPTKDENGIAQANLNDPIQMLQILEKMVKIQSSQQLQAKLRRIIVQANILQRTHFNEFINDTFNVKKIFKRIQEKLTSQNNIILQLRAENGQLKQNQK